MVRTQIQLPEEQVALLKKMAAERHVSMAEVIRQAVALFSRTQGPGAGMAQRRRALGAAGRFNSGTGDLSSRHDDYLDEIYGR